VSSVSVIIPAINEAERVGRAVRSAIDNRADEIIVVDGGSDDSTVAAAREAGATVVAAVTGRGSQQHRGAECSGGAILLFLHADAWLDAGVLPQIRRCAAESGKPIWGALCQRIDAPGIAFRLLERGNAARVRLRGVPFGDQAIFVERTLYEAAGGFADLPLMEDLLLSRRLRRHRWPRLLPGRVHVDPRRWQRQGVLRQTLRNWRLQWQLARGVPVQQIAAAYRRHDL
jgi:rSAM/selenodomain-associated transferase 2